ncbi:Epoxide hydrolase domain protein [Mycena venus]|uniref:Epoxide hydrolase domain protein n=1 Tax=Mycena venus TaxID=2733690 RepID=A0A8H6Y3W5_9AGAR|nr:Epoxide hydrolase domain protein [Mycena venus]
MRLTLNFIPRLVLATAFTTIFVAASASNTGFDVKLFKIDLAGEIPHLKSLVKNTRLPATALYPNAGPSKGIDLETLRNLRTDWLTKYDWEAQQAELNQFNHFTTVIEGITVHFVHEKSAEPDAIPVILLHGWPGSFHEFVPVIKPLTESALTSTGNKVAFNVVVPSLPGFVFSSAPPTMNWTNDDTARIFNTLMTEALGYSTYAVHGTDWGSGVGYSMYASFQQNQEIAENNITLSDVQKVTEQRFTFYESIGNGYFTEQTTKPNDIGLALNDNPVGQLAWIGSKFKLCVNTPIRPEQHRNPHFCVTLLPHAVVFLSSVWIYAQNPTGFQTVYTKAATDAPLLFSQFEYNPALWPEEYVARLGNLVSYKVHDFGGHFAGLDNPPALIEDIRDIGIYFKA